jgi:hypothetical protein
MDKRFRNISFTTESIDEFIQKYKSQEELLPVYLDKIRNGYELTEDDFDKIMDFDNTSKLKLLKEYNRVMKIFNDSLKSENL